ncbi:MAG: exosortase/archaeosortase family protein [Verrucomicrobiales bacterium]|nr:exosortase/archaeosortase family protein [Verrucomicrobiales bacterium]
MSSSAPDTAPATDAPADTSAEGASTGTARQGLDARWLALGCFTLCLVLLYAVWPYQNWQFDERSSILSGWFRSVLRDSEWTFCLVVPPIVAYLVWKQADQLRALPLRGSWGGVGLVVLALLVYWMGYKVNTGYLGFFSAHTMVLGLILLIGGPQWTRALFFPWLFLTFMWPLFPLEERLAFPLRMLTANLSAKLLNLLHLDVIREGTALHSASDAAAGIAPGERFQLDVSEPCSGIRSLFSLMMVSALYGYLVLKSPVSRLILFASSIPLAVAGNLVRMVMLTAGSYWFGSEFAVGRNIDGHQEMSTFHSLAGYAVFAVALGGMFAICSLLEGRHWKRLKTKRRSSRSATALARPSITRHLLASCGVALVLCVSCLAWCSTLNLRPQFADPGVTLDLPLRVSAYQGRPMEITTKEKELLNPEGVELARTAYLDARRREIIATIIVGGPGKRTLHRPEVCLPGQGWSIVDSNEITIPLQDGRNVHATVLRLLRDRIDADGQRLRFRGLNIYWYVGSDGSTVADFYGHVTQGYRDAILKNLNHRWSMVSVFTPVWEGPVGREDPFEELRALDDTKAFITELAPQLMILPPES